MTKRAIREIIEIDEDLCDGCGLCIPNCEEGALVIIDGKARLVDDARCDGAGACLGTCPQGALRVIHRDAAEFDDKYAPAANPGPGPMRAPMKQAGSADVVQIRTQHVGGGCPGSRAMAWTPPGAPPSGNGQGVELPSALRQWPIQLHLLSPQAVFLRGRELLLAADCVAFAMGGFHNSLLSERSLAIACPKLDDPSGYEQKLIQILSECDVPALRVAIMEVPCCGGLVQLAMHCAQQAHYEGQVEVIVVSRFGELLERRVLASGTKEAASSAR